MIKRKDLEALKAELDQLASIDPTPENREMVRSLVSSVRARVQNVLGEKLDA